jgi:hypothetical protein
LERFLFKNIALVEDRLKFQSCPFKLYFDYILNFSLGVDISESISGFEYTNSIDQWVTSVSSSLSVYKAIVNRFNLAGVEKAGYYLLPILNIFDNLTFLRLECCDIPFMDFSNLSESLLSLEVMELVYVTFIKLSPDSISNSQFIFPQNLKSLKIYYCETSVEPVLSPKEFLFNYSELTTATSFILPEYSVSSLKELGFFSSYGSDGGINQFIKLNPELESLIIKSHSLNYITLSLIKSLTSLKSLEMRGSVSLNPEAQFPTLEFINKLRFDDVSLNNIEIIKKMCLSCPNLMALNIQIVAHKNFQNTIDKHIAQISNYLPKLRFFNFIIIGNIFEKIDFSTCCWLETLVVESGQLTVLNSNFESCKKLKKVTFKSFGDINTPEFKNKFNSIEGWKFKFSLNIIKGYKLL